MSILWTILLSAGLIGLSTEVASRNPAIAGLIMALPLSPLLALTITYWRSGDAALTARFATGILAAAPIGFLLFAPFLLYPRWQGSFWAYLGAGLLLVVTGYGLQTHWRAADPAAASTPGTEVVQNATLPDTSLRLAVSLSTKGSDAVR